MLYNIDNNPNKVFSLAGLKPPMIDRPPLPKEAAHQSITKEVFFMREDVPTKIKAIILGIPLAFVPVLVLIIILHIYETTANQDLAHAVVNFLASVFTACFAAFGIKILIDKVFSRRTERLPLWRSPFFFP